MKISSRLPKEENMIEKTCHPCCFPILRKIPGKNRDKRDGKKTAGHNVIQNFRNHKSDLIRIDIRTPPTDISNRHQAEQSKQPAQKNRSHHDNGGDSNFSVDRCGHRQRVNFKRL